MTKMIPPVPTSAVMMPTPKQKIGFSIESIVGNDAATNTNTTTTAAAADHQTLTQIHQLHQQQQQQLHHHIANSPKSSDIQDIINRLHNSAAAVANNNISLSSAGSYSPPQSRLTPDEPVLRLKRERSPDYHHHRSSPPSSHQSHSPISTHPAAQHYSKAPMMMPGMPPAGLVRPFPVGPPPDIKALPPYINAPPPQEMSVPPQHNPHLIAAAQFQMAAALQAGHAAAAAAGLQPHSPFMANHPAVPRDSYPLYPWLLSRHGRIFPHRFPGNFLLQPFRKPKRIRTAFSPSQLLKLEHAFESNQYVVGAERKALAQSLNLSETQVKVWFQNRRTKHKRMQQEDEKGGGGGGSSSERGNDEDDELIDMEMDDCPSDDELDASH